MRYALYFVPHKLEREKLALLRRQLCKRFDNRKAVMYPVHLTLVRSLKFQEYKEFIASLQKFCASQKPVKLTMEKHLATRQSWGGVVVKNTPALERFQQKLVEFCSLHGKGEPFAFEPHISLVYAKNLPSLHNRTSPVKKMLLDRIALALQTAQRTPYRIMKQIEIGK